MSEEELYSDIDVSPDSSFDDKREAVIQMAKEFSGFMDRFGVNYARTFELINKLVFGHEDPQKVKEEHSEDQLKDMDRQANVLIRVFFHQLQKNVDTEAGQKMAENTIKIIEEGSDQKGSVSPRS